MLLLEGYISNFTCTRYYFLYVEFSDFYVNQSLAGQTIVRPRYFDNKPFNFVCLHVVFKYCQRLLTISV
jgi:hypothetical protein